MLKIMNRLSKIWITSNGYVTLNMFENLILLFPPSTILSHYSILHVQEKILRELLEALNLFAQRRSFSFHHFRSLGEIILRFILFNVVTHFIQLCTSQKRVRIDIFDKIANVT